MHDHHDLTSQQTEGNPSFFAVVFPVIFEGEGRTGKDQLCVGEIQASSIQSSQSLRLEPSETHGWYYAYDRVYVNARDERFVSFVFRGFALLRAFVVQTLPFGRDESMGAGMVNSNADSEMDGHMDG